MISMRSIKAGGIERVRRRHEHHVRQIVIDLEIVVVEGVVLLGVQHFEQCEAGSPRKSAPILSTSSSRKSGLIFFAFRIDWMTLRHQPI